MPIKNVHVTLLWLVLATFFAGAAVWQAQVVAHQPVGGRRSEPLPPPVKTRHFSRDQAATFAGDPHDAYVGRRKKGLIEREIDWILDDFRAVGLDQPPGGGKPEDYLAYRRKQQRWYLAALTDALHLTSAQIMEAEGKMRTLYQTDATAFLEIPSEIKPVSDSKGNSLTVAAVDQFDTIPTAARWINRAQGAFLPEKLCTLTPSQAKILSGNRATGFPSEFQEVENLLPFSGQLPEDLLEDPHWDSEMLAMGLAHFHPAQLKLLLLFNPKATDRIDSAAWAYPEALPDRDGQPRSR